MKNNTYTLEEYLNLVSQDGTFVIPSYQRGYVWGQEKTNQKQNSVDNILDTLIDGFNNDKDVFLQGITVCEVKPDIVLVDGQQRTTFFYLFLKYLGYDNRLNIKYDVRKESDVFLQTIDVQKIVDEHLNEDEPFQDIYFFKKTVKATANRLKNFDKIAFLKYVLQHVRFLYIPIPESKATIIFSIMNGNKAQMLDQ